MEDLRYVHYTPDFANSWWTFRFMKKSDTPCCWGREQHRTGAREYSVAPVPYAVTVFFNIPNCYKATAYFFIHGGTANFPLAYFGG